MRPALNAILKGRSRDVEHPYLAAATLVLIAFAVRFPLNPVLLDRSPFMLFTVAIVIAAGRYGTAAGVLAMALSLALAIGVFLAPGHTMFLEADQLASLAIFIVTGIAMLVFASHLKALTERERELQLALQQRHTESAMGTMAATLAHELNQPLAAAANYVSAGKRIASGLKGQARESLMSGLSEAEDQIHRAGDIIRHARGLVSNPSAVREPTSLRSIIANVVKPLRASGALEGAKLQTAIDEKADRLVANPIQIEQVLLNLVRNACQAARPGEPAEIDVTAKVEGKFVLMEVRDLGRGISSERMATLFSPDARASEGGLGLGLSISRTIIEAHGGKLWAKNNPQGGASFFFTIPKRQRPA